MYFITLYYNTIENGAALFPPNITTKIFATLKFLSPLANFKCLDRWDARETETYFASSHYGFYPTFLMSATS